MGAISGGIRPGMALYFQGTVPQKADIFMISLKTGQFRGDDIAFRFKPCIGQRVVLNSFRNLKWESEESASDKPFTKGAPFTIIYVIKPEGYEVCFSYKHRIPLEKVTTLDLDGDVTFNMLGVIEVSNVMDFCVHYDSFHCNFVDFFFFSQQKIPYMGAISGGIRPGMALYFQGTVPQKADKYAVSTGQAPGDDTAFHFNPRIGDRVALNSFSNGRWESEETASDKPFTKGKPFTMNTCIINRFDIFVQVYVNGFQHCLFKHRIPLEKVSALGLEGDVTINILGVIEVSNVMFFLCTL
uniref:Galectin n=1 Tax=Pygocentrus nattereri TaxID=42514 RepID=A0A3B4E0Z3_PYGNA